MLKYLLEKEFKQFFRNKALPKMAVIMPFMAILIFPLVANFEIKNISLAVVDNDKSSTSRELIQKVAAGGYFSISEVASTYTHALRSVELDKSDIIMEIPAHLERDLQREGSSEILISANAVSATKGGLGSAYLAGIIGDFNKEINGNISTVVADSFTITPRFWYNPRLLYTYFMVPALMVMVLAMVCGFLPALNIVGEKESGTIEQINVTPVTRLSFILSKLLPYWIIGFVVLTISFFAAWIAYGLTPAGNLGTIYLFAALFVLAFSGFGLVISNYATTLQQAMFMMFFFVLTFIFMSGLYTPVANMPRWAQNLSIISPLKYIIIVLRQVYLKGSTFTELLTPFWMLTAFAIFFNGWAVLSYRKKS
ncbi:MAG: ABC transporter permease [Bacteroidetes bacterium 41-46]|nr:MAG: ABC transporter permease [Bacteroidetes bacterium 41-46]